MEELRKDVDEQAKRLDIIDEKLDRLILDVTAIKAQWKLVGAVLGILAGMASGWMFQ